MRAIRHKFSHRCLLWKVRYPRPRLPELASSDGLERLATEDPRKPADPATATVGLQPHASRHRAPGAAPSRSTAVRRDAQKPHDAEGHLDLPVQSTIDISRPRLARLRFLQPVRRRAQLPDSLLLQERSREGSERNVLGCSRRRPRLPAVREGHLHGSKTGCLHEAPSIFIFNLRGNVRRKLKLKMKVTQVTRNGYH